MNKAEVDIVMQEFFPRFWRGDYISYQRTNGVGTTLIETKEWHNRAVQCVYNKDGVVTSCIVVITATLGLNRTTCKEVKSIDELRVRLFNRYLT